MQKSAGFTLIELIIVIVILGILAAYAVPKFMAVDKEARVAVVKSLAGAVRTASDLVRALAVAQGKHHMADSTVNIGGITTVAIGYGYAKATADGIPKALNSSLTEHIAATANAGSMEFSPHNVINPALCRVVYSYTIAVGSEPSITVFTSDCS